jgi:phage gp16-like protein
MKPNKKLITTIPVELSSQELSIIKTCLALTISSIIRTQEKARNKISIDPKTLEDLYKRLDNLQLKLSKINTPPD